MIGCNTMDTLAFSRGWISWMTVTGMGGGAEEYTGHYKLNGDENMHSISRDLPHYANDMDANFLAQNAARARSGERVLTRKEHDEQFVVTEVDFIALLLEKVGFSQEDADRVQEIFDGEAARAHDALDRALLVGSSHLYDEDGRPFSYRQASMCAKVLRAWSLLKG